MTNAMGVTSEGRGRAERRLPIVRAAAAPRPVPVPPAGWAGVAIGDAQVCADAPDGEPRLRAKATVRLRDLLPADVRVELLQVPAAAVRAQPGAIAVPARRMFSVASLHNGEYRYEAELPLDPEPDAHRWVVRVTPAAPGDDARRAPALPAVERRVGTRARRVD